MPANKIENNEGENAAKGSPLYINSDLRSLIGELILPRIGMLRNILNTSFVTQMKSLDDQEAGEDSYLDYKIYSEMHFMTDMNGLIHLMQSSLKGLSDELTIIGGKFQAFISDKFKLRLSGEEQDGDKETDGQTDLFGRYLLVQSLIKDMEKFVNCCNRQCLKCLKERGEFADRAMETNNPRDRIYLMIYDEQSFIKLLGRMDSLKSFLQNFCALFEDESKAEVEEESNEGQSEQTAS